MLSSAFFRKGTNSALAKAGQIHSWPQLIHGSPGQCWVQKDSQIENLVLPQSVIGPRAGCNPISDSAIPQTNRTYVLPGLNFSSLTHIQSSTTGTFSGWEASRIKLAGWGAERRNSPLLCSPVLLPLSYLHLPITCRISAHPTISLVIPYIHNYWPTTLTPQLNWTS